MLLSVAVCAGFRGLVQHSSDGLIDRPWGEEKAEEEEAEEKAEEEEEAKWPH